MAEMKPRVRFSGFYDNWEQHKLGNYFTERVERSAEGELISVTMNSGVMRAADLGRHDNSSEDKSHYKRVEVGDIAYNSMRMWQGASGYSPYSGILSPAYTVAKPQEGVDSLFFAYMFKKPELIHQFEVNSQGLTKDTWNLKFPPFSEIEVKAPAYEEQVKISAYLHHLDRLTTLHQQKYDKLVNLKKSMLEKMFPKYGLDVPEIRFKSFSARWKRKRLDELSEKVCVGIATSSSKYFTDREKGVPFIKNQNIKGGSIDDSKLDAITYEFDEMNKSKRLLPGDIITVRTGYPGLSAVVPAKLEGAQTFTTLITRLKASDVTPEFVVVFINSYAGMKQIDAMQAGGAQKNVNANTLRNLDPNPKNFVNRNVSHDMVK